MASVDPDRHGRCDGKGWCDEEGRVLVLNVPIERRTVTVRRGERRRRLSVLVAGSPGPRPPVLAVHGLGSSAEDTWQRTGHLLALARAGRWVIAPDLLGHGQSDAPDAAGEYTVPALTDWLTGTATAVLAEHPAGRAGDEAAGSGPGPELDLPELDLLGYSLGARLGWTLLTAAPSPNLPIRRAVLGGFDGRALLAEVPAEDLPSAPPAVLAGLDGTPRATGRPQQPLLLVAGTDDRVSGGAERLAASLPSATFLPVPGRDHVSTVTARAFRHGAVDFLAG